MAARKACLVMTEYESRAESFDMESMACLLTKAGVCSSKKAARTDLKAMLAAGSRYRNLEKSLGRGVCFVLGTSFPESCWTKLFPKSDSRLIKHCRNIGLDGLAQPYSNLRDAVIEVALEALLG